MGQVLYRKYRSKKLAEIVGQEPITKTLGEALKTDRLSHAYLFTGPRGVGKTSVARILAHEVNNLPYSDDTPHIDIIEIDAASNRRIDEIRDLREKVHTLPASAKYKVYIIDEVHMLTKEAFNALLKTLEEPPAHVIFILATTDPHKLPETIISRTQRFSFKPIDQVKVTQHLKAIAKEEKIKIDDEALGLIAEHGEGSFRDSISLLDQLGSSQKPLTGDDVRTILGVPPAAAIEQLVSLIESPSTSYKQLTDKLQALYDQGFAPGLLTKQLMNDLRLRLVSGHLSLPPAQAISLLKELLGVESAPDPGAYLLLALLAQLSAPNTASPEPALGPEPPVEPAPADEPKAKDPKPEPKTKTTKQPADESVWPHVLTELKNRYNTLYGIVRMAQPVFKDHNQLDLIFDFAFHKKQVSEAKNKQIIASIILDLTDQDFKIECYLNEAGPKPAATEISRPSNSDLDNINRIFGGGEVVD